MDVKKEFEEKYMRQEMLKREFDAYVKERDELDKTLQEIVMTESSIDEIISSGNGSNILTNIGSGTFVKTSLKDDKELLVSIGSGVVIKCTPSESKKILSERIEKLRKADFEYMNKINSIAAEMNKIQKELDELSMSVQM